MSRAKWIQEMIEGGMTKEEVIENIVKGSEEKGVSPLKGENVQTFAKLNYSKVSKKLGK